MQSTRFALGVHVLVVLAVRDGDPVPSETIAASINTNPSFVRQILSRLREAGLVATRLGSGGGAVIARPASRIRLDEVHRLMERGPTVAVHHSEPSAKCVVGRHIVPLLCEVLDRAESARLGELRKVTIADLARQVLRRG